VKNVGETPVVGNLISFSDTPASIKGGAPELGADTESVLTSLGFTNDDIKSVVEHADNERRMALADRVVDEK
jgi:crotonobetainyl-CoA:carnitine CoA-transferase CaiB-like acyl-CoA transferase